MQDRAPFGFVDAVPGKHLPDGIAELGFLGKAKQKIEGFFADPVFGEIHQDIAKTDAKSLESFRVLGEEGFQGDGFYLVKMIEKPLPALRPGRIDPLKHGGILHQG